MTEGERNAVLAILERLEPTQRDRLLADFKSARIEALNAGGTILRFHLPNHVPERPGKMPLRVEGRVLDVDGEAIDVVLYDDANGRLFEFELIRHAKGEVIDANWDTFEIL